MRCLVNFTRRCIRAAGEDLHRQTKTVFNKKILSIQSGHPKEIAVASKDKTSAGCKHYVIDFHELFDPCISYGETLLKMD